MPVIVDGITKTPEGKLHARRIGEFLNHDEAVAAAKRLIDAYLFQEYRQAAGHGISAQKLLAQYRRTAEVPYIWRKSRTSTNMSSFDHLAYATTRCAEICGGKKG